MGGMPFIDYLYQNSASVDGQWNGVWGIMRVYNGRLGLKTDLLALPNNTAGAADLTTNDSEFPVDSTFPNGATDFNDTTDPSVMTYSTSTTDTTLMSSTMLGTTTLTSSSSTTTSTTTQTDLIGPILIESDIVRTLKLLGVASTTLLDKSLVDAPSSWER